MSKLKVLDLFSGIGGFSLGLDRTGGFETIAFCEIEKFPQKVLAKHWPGIKIYEDVRNVTAEQLRSDGIFPDVITGGFPCQDISVAGNQAGIGEGTRSGLWSECARLLGEVRPQFAIFENVAALLNGGRGDWFKRVLWDVSQVGYDAEWHCIPASELGAHHHRDRIWIIAYPDGGGRNNDDKREGRSEGAAFGEALSSGEFGRSIHEKTIRDSRSIKGDGAVKRSREENVADANSPQRERNSSIGILAPYADIGGPSRWPTEPGMGRVANGIPDRAHRLKGLGNAVVPQIPELIGRAILDSIELRT